MSLLASLAFVFAAIVVVTALRSTIAQFADATIGNAVALRDCGVSRDFRVQAVTVLARPVVTADVRRTTARRPARRIKLRERLRAAA